METLFRVVLFLSICPLGGCNGEPPASNGSSTPPRAKPESGPAGVSTRPQPESVPPAPRNPTTGIESETQPEKLAATLKEEASGFWVGRTKTFPSDTARTAAARLVELRPKSHRAVHELVSFYSALTEYAMKEARREGKTHHEGPKLVYDDPRVNALWLVEAWLKSLEKDCE